jgi:hypothetical protein
MGSTSKTFALILIGVMAVSCVGLLTVKPADAQSTPMPSVPEFTAKFVTTSYTVTTTNPYTGVNTTAQIDNSTIQIMIKNQQLAYGSDYHLYYEFRMKPHFNENWTEYYSPVSLFSGSNLTLAQYLSTIYYSYSFPESNSAYTILSLSASGYQPNYQIDFEVTAELGINSTFYSVHTVGEVPIGAGQYEPAIAYLSTSGWSNTQTVTIPASSTSPNPTQSSTIPEFSWLAILPLLLSLFSVAVVFRNRKVVHG